MVNVVWNEIDAALKRLQKTQEWLAGELDLSNNAITKWKQSGKISRHNAERVSGLLNIPLNIPAALKFAKGLGVNVAEFSPTLARQLGEIPNDTEGDVGQIFMALPKDDRQSALDFISFRFQKAEQVIGSDKLAHYMAMIDRIKKDMDGRKKPPKGKK